MQKVITLTFAEDDSKAAIVREVNENNGAVLYDVSYNGKAIGAISFNGFFYIVNNRPYTTISAATKQLINKVQE